MGRGKAARSLELIAAAIDILEVIQPATVRAICYQLFIRKLIPSMAKKDTNRVSTQLRDAREAGSIPWAWIVDETRAVECVNAWADPAAYVETVNRSYLRDRWHSQSTHVEVWAEKGTVRGTLASVLDGYGVPFRVMHGYGSATTIHEVAEESRHDVKPWVALYLGDWDPSGLHMSDVDLPDRIDRYGGDIEIERVALTTDHVLRGGLPSFSVHDKTQDPRYAWFRDVYGVRCWELDALSPVLLREAVEAAILDHLDVSAWRRADAAERAERESLMTILAGWPGISGSASE